MGKLLLLLTLASCDDTAKTATGTIDPQMGGVVAMSDGSASVSISAGALTTATQVTVTSDSTTPPASLGQPVSSCFRFGPEGQQFQKPVSITLAVELARIPAGKTLSDVFIATAPAGSSDFVALATKIADATHVIANTTHFSVLCALSSPEQDASVPMDLSGHDLTIGSDLMPTPSPSCSPYPSPSPNMGCLFGPVPSNFTGCGWVIQCIGPTYPYEVNCDATTCTCYHGGVVTDSFPKGNYCDIEDAGVNGSAWQRCCYPP